MRRFSIASLALVCYFYSFGQKGNQNDAPQSVDSLRKYEMILKGYSDTILDSKTELNRIIATVNFIPTFVKALKFPGSYTYPFDSLTFMHKLEPNDNSFRLYNWVLKYSDGSCRYYAAIQWNTHSDSLKLT